MINKFRRLLFLFFKKIIPINWLVEAINKEHIQLNESNCLKDSTAYLHYDSRIINLQNNPKKIRIGKMSMIRGELFINEYGGEIEIGNASYLGEHSRIWSGNKVLVGNNVQISHNVNIIDTNTHSLDASERINEYYQVITSGNIHKKGNIKTAPIIIKDNVWISFNVTILKGVTIGEGAIIAANTLVTKDIPSHTMAAGYPARIIKQLN